MTAKKCTKERDARAKLFCQSKLIAFLPLSLPSPSSLLPNTNTVDINCTDIDRIRDGRRLLRTAEGEVAQLFR